MLHRACRGRCVHDAGVLQADGGWCTLGNPDSHKQRSEFTSDAHAEWLGRGLYAGDKWAIVSDDSEWTERGLSAAVYLRAHGCEHDDHLQLFRFAREFHLQGIACES